MTQITDEAASSTDKSRRRLTLWFRLCAASALLFLAVAIGLLAAALVSVNSSASVEPPQSFYWMTGGFGVCAVMALTAPIAAAVLFSARRRITSVAQLEV